MCVVGQTKRASSEAVPKQPSLLTDKIVPTPALIRPESREQLADPSNRWLFSRLYQFDCAGGIFGNFGKAGSMETHGCALSV
jgi:hypothetical protein